MTWRVPTWWNFVLLSLAAYRLVRLIAWDDITASLRRRVYGMTDYEYHELARAVDTLEQKQGVDAWRAGSAVKIIDGDGVKTLKLPSRFRFDAARWGHCPWCCGAWISAAWWLAWLAWPHGVLVTSAPFAVSSVVGLVAKQLDA